MLKNLVISLLFISSAFGGNPIRGGKPSATQGGDLFYQGNYLEWSVNPGGVFGNRDPVQGQSYGGTFPPAGYHNNVTGRVGVIVDYDLNGFDVGSPAHSGDAFAEGYNDVGFHVSFVGQRGLEAWNNMPLLNDDDDGDTDYSPYRGCINCVKGQRTDLCEPYDGDCGCNADIEATDYICPFKRWDLVTSSFTDASNDTVFSVIWIGVARAAEFKDDKSGTIKQTNEEITITKNIWSKINDTVIFEFVEVTNSGSATVSDINLFWSIVPTLEAFPHSKFGKSPSTDFANYFNIAYQPTDTNSPKPKALVTARGQWYNMSLSMGTVDQDARVWYESASSWRASARPYTGDKAFAAAMPKSTKESFGEYAMGLATVISTLAPGESQGKKMFWAFHTSQIDYAFDMINNTVMMFTTSVLTTAPITTSPVTTQAIPITSGKQITSAALTTAEHIPIKQLGTTGLMSTTSPMVTTASVVQTGEEVSSTGESNLASSSQSNEKQDIKIIASIFGVAGGIILILAIGGIILAVRRLKSNPVN